MNSEQRIITDSYDKLSLKEKQLVHQLYHKQEHERTTEYNALRKLIFKVEPPTPEQFLNPQYGWLPKNFTDALYPHVIDDFIEICNPQKKYKQIVQYGSTRLGKTYLARLVIMYIIVWCHCLRHPQLYYGLSPTTVLSIYSLCFNAEKVKQLMLKPLYDLFMMSERFKNIKFQDKVKDEQYKVGNDIIVWSKAAVFGEITLASNTTINLGTDFMSFIGADLLFLVVSEIAFFVEKMGDTHDEIFQIYSDGLGRIKATVGNNYLGAVYLDTSANTTDNPIEQYILNEVQFQENVFFRRRNQWEARPYLFPKWQTDKDTFKVFTGNSSFPAKIIKVDEASQYPRNLIIEVPIDAHPEFERNLNKSLKDIAGIPTTMENKFINSNLLIDNIFNNESLRNVEGIIYAEATEQPELLLWRKIKDVFFLKNEAKENNYIIYRAPKEVRYIGIDLAHAVKGDIQGFCMLHKEWSMEKENIVYVVDFCFGVGAKESAINLEAPFNLVVDIRMFTEIPIYASFIDSFQSQVLIQLSERSNMKTIKQSVDISLNPYQYLLTCLSNETLKAGKNIFLKNNLDSLVHVRRNDKERIDHTKGKTSNIYNGNWTVSDCGSNAKDVSDAVCQALWGAKNHDYMPSTIYEYENKRFSNDPKTIESNIKEAWNSLHGTRMIPRAQF